MRPAREINQPTYEIVGEVERYDQRDAPNARTYLIPGTAEYDDYYSRRPELKEWDDEVRRVLAAALQKSAKTDFVNLQFAPAVFFGKKITGYSNIVEGTIDQKYISWHATAESERRCTDIDPGKMAKKIKGFGRYLGAAKVRITKLKQEWVQTYHSNYYGSEPYGKPVKLDYANIICMAFRFNPAMHGGKTDGIEGGWKEACASLASDVMAQFVRNCGWRARALPPENGPYLVVPTFVDAGMGEQGRCGITITKEFGSWFLPGAVATDMPLALDKPVDFGIQDFCEKCTICAEHCPANAISFGGRQVVRGVRRWHIDNNKCRLQWSTMGRACGRCQLVCPWNHPNNMVHDTIRELNQSLPFVRTFFLAAERSFHYKHKPPPTVDWVSMTGLRES